MFNHIQPKFNGLVLDLWSTLLQTYMKIGQYFFEISSRQTNRGENITPLAEVIIDFSYFYFDERQQGGINEDT